MNGVWKRSMCRACGVALLLVGLTIPAAADVTPPRLVGTTTLRLPATLEVVTARPLAGGTLTPPPQTVTLPPGFGGGTLPVIGFADGDLVPVKRTGPDGSGLYHHFLRLVAAPLGPQMLELDARTAPDGTGEQASVPVTIAASSFHGLRLLPLQLTQEHVRSSYSLDAYTNTFATVPARWRTTITIERQTGSRWVTVATRDSRTQPRGPHFEYLHSSQPTLLPIDTLMHRRGHFRVVVTETASAGHHHFRQTRTLDPWQPRVTTRYCLLLMGPRRDFCVSK